MPRNITPLVLLILLPVLWNWNQVFLFLDMKICTFSTLCTSSRFVCLLFVKLLNLWIYHLISQTGIKTVRYCYSRLLRPCWGFSFICWMLNFIWCLPWIMAGDITQNMKKGDVSCSVSAIVCWDLEGETEAVELFSKLLFSNSSPELLRDLWTCSLIKQS